MMTDSNNIHLEKDLFELRELIQIFRMINVALNMKEFLNFSSTDDCDNGETSKFL